MKTRRKRARDVVWEGNIEGKIRIVLLRTRYVKRVYQQTLGIDSGMLGCIVNVGVLFDNKLAGCASFARTKGKELLMLKSVSFKNKLVSAFGRLILLLLISSEAKQMIEKRYGGSYDVVITSVISKWPESMLFRGVFKKYEMIKEGPYYYLKYRALFGLHTIRGARALWKDKYQKN